MNEAPTADIMRLAKWAIRSWEGHEEYADMLQESYVQAWKGYQAGVAMGARSPLAVATKQAKWGPHAWLNCWNGHPTRAPRRHAAQHVSLEVLEFVAVGTGWEDRVLTRLERQDVVRRVWMNCTPRQRQVLYRVIWLQETKKECAAALGIAEGTVKSHYKTAVDLCRQWVQP